MSESFFHSIRERYYPEREKLKERLDELAPKKRIVFTNGCFDLLHVGHVSYLSRARDLGDVLVVGVNSDESVRSLNKGPNRPVNAAEDRCLVLAGLACVDYVTIFSESTPIETLKLLRPHIHVKGGDYKAEDLPERAVIESYGGKIVIIPFVPGYSTTSILAGNAR